MSRIEISAPYINKEEALANIAQALESGQIAMGPQVLEAEAVMRESFGSEHAAALTNGTASLRAALVAATAVKHNIQEEYIDRKLADSQVVVPAFSFNATLNTVLQTGARARIVDINPDDFCIDREATLNALTSNTVAIMPVDLYGQPSEITTKDAAFSEVAVVRDAAQAHGARLNGEAIVSHSDATSLSFYPTKNIAAPEGGAVLTNNADIDRIVRIYRNQGMQQRYEYSMMGDNLRMTDIHAAILRANLGLLSMFTARRQENALALTDALDGIEGLTVPKVMPGREHVWHQYTVLINEDFGIDRGSLHTKLNENGIGTGVYYPKTMTDHQTFRDHPRIWAEETPVADRIATQALSLPVHPKVSSSDIDRIGDTIIKIQKGEL